MKYIDIKPTIKILLEKEKKEFIKLQANIPVAHFFPYYKCFIVTAPIECEGMQIVGEFTEEPALKNLVKTYAVVGNQATDIEKRILINLISQSFNLSLNDQEKLKAIYNQLLLNSNNKDFSNYLNYCQNLKKQKRNNR